MNPLSGHENFDENVIVSFFLSFLGNVSFSYSTINKPSERFTAVSTLSASLFPRFEFNIILSTIIEKFKGGPVGLTTIATAVGEQSGTIEEVYEPFLIMDGYIMRTPRGRQATDKAFKHLGLEKSNDEQGNLF